MPDPGDLATAFVTILPDMSRFVEELSADLEEATAGLRPTVQVEAVLDTTRLDADLGEADSMLTAFTAKKWTVRLGADISGLAAKVVEAKSLIEGLNSVVEITIAPTRVGGDGGDGKMAVNVVPTIDAAAVTAALAEMEGTLTAFTAQRWTVKIGGDITGLAAKVTEAKALIASLTDSGNAITLTPTIRVPTGGGGDGGGTGTVLPIISAASTAAALAAAVANPGLAKTPAFDQFIANAISGAKTRAAIAANTVATTRLLTPDEITRATAVSSTPGAETAQLVPHAGESLPDDFVTNLLAAMKPDTQSQLYLAPTQNAPNIKAIQAAMAADAAAAALNRADDHRQEAAWMISALNEIDGTTRESIATNFGPDAASLAASRAFASSAASQHVMQTLGLQLDPDAARAVADGMFLLDKWGEKIVPEKQLSVSDAALAARFAAINATLSAWGADPIVKKIEPVVDPAYLEALIAHATTNIGADLLTLNRNSPLLTTAVAEAISGAGAGRTATYTASQAGLFPAAAGSSGGGGGGGAIGLLGFLGGGDAAKGRQTLTSLLWGGGSAIPFLGGLAGMGSVGSLAGLGAEHVIMTGVGLAGSAVGAGIGAGVLGAGALGVAGVGFGTDLAGIGQAAGDIKNTYTALGALSTATTQFGASSVNALQAQTALNGVLDGFSPIARGAVLQVAQMGSTIHAEFNSVTGQAEKMGAQILGSFGTVAENYIPVIGKFATTNMGIIQNLLKPFTAWLSNGMGGGLGIFTMLEEEFTKGLPDAMGAGTNAVEVFMKAIGFASQYTGGFVTELDKFFTKLNTPAGTSGLETFMAKMIGDFRAWDAFIKILVKDIYDLFSHDAGTGVGIIKSLTDMLDKLHEWETSVAGGTRLSSIFTQHKAQVLALLSVLPDLLRALSPITAVMSAMAGATVPVIDAFVKLISVIEHLPLGMGTVATAALGIILVLGKLTGFGTVFGTLIPGMIGLGRAAATSVAGFLGVDVAITGLKIAAGGVGLALIIGAIYELVHLLGPLTGGLVAATVAAAAFVVAWQMGKLGSLSAGLGTLISGLGNATLYTKDAAAGLDGISNKAASTALAMVGLTDAQKAQADAAVLMTNANIKNAVSTDAITASTAKAVDGLKKQAIQFAAAGDGALRTAAEDGTLSAQQVVLANSLRASAGAALTESGALVGLTVEEADAAISAQVLRDTTITLNTILSGIGAVFIRAGTAIGGFIGMEAAADGATLSLGVSLGLVAAAVLPIAAAVVGLGVAWKIGSDAVKHFNDQVAAVVTPLTSLPQTTLPQLNGALRDTQSELDITSKKAQTTKDAFQAFHDWNPFSAGFYSGLTDPSNTVNTQAGAETIQLTAFVAKIKTETKDLNANAAELGKTFGLTTTQAAALGQSAGIDLTKKLDPTTFVKFKTALDEMTSSSGLGAAALSRLASSSGQSMAQITQQTTAAASAMLQTMQTMDNVATGATAAQSALATAATQAQINRTGLNTLQSQYNAAVAQAAVPGQSVAAMKANADAVFAGASNIASAISQQDLTGGFLTNTPQAIGNFYSGTLLETQTFTKGISQLMKEGFSASVIGPLLTAGPAAALPTIEGLLSGAVSATGTNFIKMVNLASTAMQHQANIAVEQAKLMAVAELPHTSTAKTMDFSDAAMIAQAENGGSKIGVALINSVQGGLPKLMAVAKEYGLTISNIELPNGVSESVQTYYAQLKAYIASQQPKPTVIPPPVIPGLPTGSLPPPADGDAVSKYLKHLHDSAPGLIGAASALNTSVANTLLSGGTIIGNAGVSQGAAAVQGVSSAKTGMIMSGGMLATSLSQTLLGGKTLLGTTGVTMGKAVTTGAGNTDGKPAGKALIQGIIDGVNADQPKLNAALLHAVKSAITTTVPDVGGQAVGHALDSGMSQGFSENQKSVDSALLAVVKNAISSAGFNAAVDAQAIGKSIDAGIAKGISTNTTAITAAATAAGAVITTTKGKVQMNSPSLVFQDIGIGLMQGLANGITSGFAEHVAPALRTAADSMTTGFNPNLAAHLNIGTAAQATNGASVSAANTVGHAVSQLQNASLMMASSIQTRAPFPASYVPPVPTIAVNIPAPSRASLSSAVVTELLARNPKPPAPTNHPAPNSAGSTSADLGPHGTGSPGECGGSGAVGGGSGGSGASTGGAGGDGLVTRASLSSVVRAALGGMAPPVVSQIGLPQRATTSGFGTAGITPAQTHVTYAPNYTISGAADQSSVAQWQALMNQHDTQLLEAIKRR